MTEGVKASAPGRAVSTRVKLARIAREAALGVGGVADVGSRRIPGRATSDGSERLEGVVCAAEPGGRYGVTLYVAAEPVPLRDLGEKVRKAVVASARRRGLAAELGPVDVVIDDVVEPVRGRA
jgi:hypothetical protein